MGFVCWGGEAVLASEHHKQDAVTWDMGRSSAKTVSAHAASFAACLESS